MAEKHVRFAELLVLHLNTRVKKQFPQGTTINQGKLREIRDCVRDTCLEVFSKSSHGLSADAINWIANQFFKSIKMSTTDGSTTINDLVVINEYNLSELPYHDIELMRNLFNETEMGQQLNEEYQRRSTS